MTARSARLALLIPETEEIPWPAMFEAALAAQASVWGGVGNLPFPLSDRLTENEIFWAIADLFDPDAFVTYAPVLGEMSQLDPAFYERTIQEHREQLSDAGEEAVSRFIEEAKEHVVLEVQPTEQQAGADSPAAGTAARPRLRRPD
jgi:hypothetical protein